MNPPDDHPADLSEKQARQLFRELSRRASRRRRWQGVRSGTGLVLSVTLIGGLLVLSVLSLATLGNSNLSPSNQSPGGESDPPSYLFDGMRITGMTGPSWLEGSQAIATVSYEAAWSANEYPGRVKCTWSVLDERGVVLGSASQYVDLPDPGPASGSVDVPIEHLPWASEPPSTPSSPLPSPSLTTLELTVACEAL